MKKIKSFFSKVNSSPIFILGNPKSGTTVIANLLSKATNQSLTSDFQNAIKHTTLQLELDFKLLNFKNFIKRWDRKQNLVFVTHYVVISEVLNYAASSGEIIISNTDFKVIDTLEIPN